MKQLRKALLVMTLTTASLSAWAQDVIVSGTVKDATGEPVIGASVVQKWYIQRCRHRPRWPLLFQGPTKLTACHLLYRICLARGQGRQRPGD